MNYYYFWNDVFEDIPLIPHCEKFVHNMGSMQMFADSKTMKAVLVQQFANDK